MTTHTRRDRTAALIVAAIAAAVLVVSILAGIRAAGPADHPTTTTRPTPTSTLMIAAAEHPPGAQVSRGTPRTTTPADHVAKPETSLVSAPAGPAPTTTEARDIPRSYGYAARRPLGRFKVTCYSPGEGFYAGKTTASGAPVGPGSIAADPKVMGARRPDGRRLELEGIGTGRWVDTGGAVKGHHLDLWRPSCAGWANPTVTVWELP